MNLGDHRFQTFHFTKGVRRQVQGGCGKGEMEVEVEVETEGFISRKSKLLVPGYMESRVCAG